MVFNKIMKTSPLIARVKQKENEENSNVNEQC